jgi:hypothetical protein
MKADEDHKQLYLFRFAQTLMTGVVVAMEAVTLLKPSKNRYSGLNFTTVRTTHKTTAMAVHKLWNLGFPPAHQLRCTDGEVLVILRQEMADYVFCLPAEPFKK